MLITVQGKCTDIANDGDGDEDDDDEDYANDDDGWPFDGFSKMRICVCECTIKSHRYIMTHHCKHLYVSIDDMMLPMYCKLLVSF